MPSNKAKEMSKDLYFENEKVVRVDAYGTGGFQYKNSEDK